MNSSLRPPLRFLTVRRIVPACVLLFAGLAPADPPAAPTNLRFVSSTANNQGSFEWDDNSDDELGFRIEFKFGDETVYRPLRVTPPDATSFGVTGFIPGTPVTFRIRAENADGASGYSNELPIITRNYHIVASCITLTPGDDFSRLIETNFGEPVAVMSTLPAWLSWDVDTQELSGQAAPAGIETVTFSAGKDGHTRQRNLYVQVINEAPELTMSPVPTELTDQPGGLPPIMVDLGSYFVDPDMGRGAALNTPFGPIRVGLYDDETDGAPGTVDNFFAYADAGRWDSSFFHRSVQNFVIQAGGFRPDGVTEGSFERVEAFDPITNEYSETRPNICGTIAMAKVGGDPDSATSEFFFSLKDNVAILDPQNGGFTVFGRAAGMGVIDQISAFPTDSYPLTIGGFPTTLSDWPLSATSENSPLVSELATISGVVEIPTLSYSLAGGDMGVATGSLDGSALTIIPIGPGQTEIMVTGTDLDGAPVTATWSIKVLAAYAAWAEDRGLEGEGSEPADNRGGGTLNNLLEYAFGGDPLSALDDGGRSPKFTEVLVGEEGAEETFDAIEFYHHQCSSDLNYTVQMSTDMSGWIDLWTSADGTEGGLVAAVEEAGSYWKLTVRAPTSQEVAGDERLFFRVSASLPEPGN